MVNLNEHLPVTDGDIVYRDLITKDNGGNYNPDTGAYTAPYNGTYTLVRVHQFRDNYKLFFIENFNTRLNQFT